MKKLLFLFGLILAFASCEGPMGPPGKDGSILYWDIRNYTVKSNEWTRVYEQGSFLYYEAMINESFLDNEMFEWGINKAYLLFSTDDGTPINQGLPYITNHEDENGTEWFQIFEYDVSPGLVVFRVKNSDFRRDNPGTLGFRVHYLLQ